LGKTYLILLKVFNVGRSNDVNTLYANNHLAASRLNLNKTNDAMRQCNHGLSHTIRYIYSIVRYSAFNSCIK